MTKSAIVAALALTTAVSQAAGVNWAPTYQSAMGQAKKSHKLVMIDFYTDWCGWCKRLDAETYPTAVVGQKSASFASVKVNAEKEGIKLAQKFQVRSFPTIIFLNDRGERVWTVQGYRPPQDFALEMQSALDSERNFTTYTNRVKANPNDADALLKLVPLYEVRDQGTAALSVLKKLERVSPESKEKALARYNQIGNSFRAKGETKTAIACYQRAIEAKSAQTATIAAGCIAMTYAQVRRADLAVPVLQKFLKRKDIKPQYRSQLEQMYRYSLANQGQAGKPVQTMGRR